MMDWQEQIIALYLIICKFYEDGLCHYNERHSFYVNLKISDEEILCLYLYGLLRKQHEIETIYNYSRDHLLDFFPTLPSYTAFVQRLNQLSDIFIPLFGRLLAAFLLLADWQNNKTLCS